jgi:hypothetical protein
MSLDWNAENVEGIDALTDDEHVLLHGLVWATLGVGFREITEENWDEFYARLAVYERVAGPMVTKNGEPYYMTKDDVRRFIGLRTNFDNETRLQWAKRIFVNPQTSRTEEFARMARREHNREQKGNNDEN